MLHLSREDVARLMAPADYVEVAAEAFAALASDRSVSPMPMHVPTDGGGFHAKAALLKGEAPVFVLKLNGNFPANPARGLPTIQGVIVLCRADDGQVLAVMDSIEITLRRTAAASAVAGRFLARPESSTVAVCGCGEQGEAQLRALASVLPLRRILAWDTNPARAASLARRCADLDLEITPDADLAACTRAADVIVTCTTAHAPFLNLHHVSPGAFVAAVGADSPDKSELDPALMAAAKVVTDATSQAEIMGDLRHAIAAAAMSAAEVHGELGDLVLGRLPGRETDDEITVFDSTGCAILDLAAAVEIHRRATGGRPIASSAPEGARFVRSPFHRPAGRSGRRPV